MYKKIYLEITNNCNLSCDFCTKNKRKNEFLSFDNFKIILNKLNNYTNYLYFHVLGEPLLHPSINEFINYASINFNINITTNGYLINKIKNNKNIRQVNISLHSFNEKYKKSIDEYLNNIFDAVDELSKTTYIAYRLWAKTDYYDYIISKLEEKYNINITNEKLNNKLTNNIYLNFHDEFIWPNLNNNMSNETGKCYALSDHIGILVDGKIVPCCLDGDGIINLGNIYKDDLETVINSKRYQNMLNGFKNNKKVEELCKKCDFLK